MKQFSNLTFHEFILTSTSTLAEAWIAYYSDKKSYLHFENNLNNCNKCTIKTPINKNKYLKCK